MNGIATMATEQLARISPWSLRPFASMPSHPVLRIPRCGTTFPGERAEALSDVTKKYLIPRLVTADKVAQAVLLLMQMRR